MWPNCSQKAKEKNKWDNKFWRYIRKKTGTVKQSLFITCLLNADWMADKFVFKVGKEKKFTGSFLPQFMTMKLSIVPAGCYFKSIEQPKVDWTVYFMAELSTVQLFKCLPPAQ